MRGGSREKDRGLVSTQLWKINPPKKKEKIIIIKNQEREEEEERDRERERQQRELAS